MILATIHIAPLATSVAEVEGLMQQGVALSVVGMGVVFVALIAIMILLGVLQKVGSLAGDAAKAPAKAHAPVHHAPLPIAAAPSESPEITAELIAVITAAAIAAVGQPIRVRRVRFAGTTNPTWAETGRRDIHVSHRLRKRHL